MQALPITYSSLIVLNLSAYPNLAIYSDGFTDDTFSLRSFHRQEGDLSQDQENCVFRILPVLNFKSNEILIDEIAENDCLQHEQRLIKRKQIVQSLILDLESELSSNISLTNKLKGTPLVFSSSQFHLVHIASMKFIALDDSNLEELRFRLIDFPNENTVLRFNPCLNFQKLRTNEVYHGDVACLSATKLVCNRHPSLFSTYRGHFYYNLKEDVEKYTNEVIEAIVRVTLENPTQFRVNLFQNHNHHEDALTIGDVVIFMLPEINQVLHVKKSKNVFDKVIQILEGIEMNNSSQQYNNYEKSELNKTLGKSGFLGLLQPQQTIFNDLGESSLSQQYEKQVSANSHNSRSVVYTKASKYVQEIKKILHTDLLVSLEDISSDIQHSTYWKIESENLQGGEVMWDKIYRIRHFQSGRYLEINNLKQIKLTSEVTKSVQFQFVPIHHKGKFVGKDSYFHLKHIQTGTYFDTSFDILTSSAEPKNEFAFKVQQADYEDVWETRFLQLSVPLLTEALNYFENLKQTQVLNFKTEDVKERLQFYYLYHRLMPMLANFEDFVYNRFASSIQMQCEYSFKSATRQESISTGNILALLLWLLVRVHPYPWEKVTQSKEMIIYELSGEKSFIYRIEALGSSIMSQKLFDKLEDNHRKRKHLLSLRVYDVVKGICSRNEQNQRQFLRCFRFLEQNLLTNYVAQTIETVLSHNYDILKDFIKKNIPQGIINALRNGDKISSPPALSLLASICQVDQQAIFDNQEFLMQALILNENQQRLLMQIFTKRDEAGYSELQVQCRDANGVNVIQDLRAFLTDNTENPHFLIQFNFLTSQLKLYAALCFRRNTLAREYFAKQFPYSMLLAYALDEQIDEEMRAHFLALIKNIYIDVEPYIMNPKPQLVHILNPIATTTQLFLFNQTQKEVEASNSTQLIKELKHKLLTFLELKHLQIKRCDQGNVIYSQLTLEVINILEMILRFDVFLTQSGELKAQPRKGVTLSGFFETKSVVQVSDIDRLVTYLASLLEYDDEYFRCMREANVIRKHDVIEEIQSLNIGNLIAMTQKLVNFEKPKQPQQTKKSQFKAADSEAINDPLFKKLKSLRKIIQKYNNKTYTLRENKQNVETLIKIQICSIFSYLIDLQQDFLIHNALSYYQNKQEDTTLSNLLPPDALCCGKSFTPILRNLYEVQQVKNFDEILQRPFIEVLLLSLYFTQNPQLENSIVELIQRFSRQKKEFLQNLNSVQVLQESSQQQLYNVWTVILQQLKNQLQYSQTWIHNPQSPIMQAVLDGLWKIDSIFQQSIEVPLDLKQKLFEFIGGFTILTELIDRAVSALDSPILMKVIRTAVIILAYFAKDNERNLLLVYRKVAKQLIQFTEYNLGQVDLLTSLFQTTPTLFGQLSPKEYQYFTALIAKYGQYPEFLHFYQQLIQLAEQFTNNSDIHKVILESLTDPDLFQSLNPFAQIRAHTDVYYDHQPNRDLYKANYLKLISKCIQRDVGISLVTQATGLMYLKDLLTYTENLTKSVMQKVIQREKPDFDQVEGKKHAWILLKIILDQNLDFLIQNDDQFFKILEMEYKGITIQELFISSELDYFFDSLLPIINSYNDRLEDALVSSQEQQDKMFRFVEFFLKNLDRMFFLAPADLLSNKRRMRTIRELEKGFRVEIPEHLLHYQKKSEDHHEVIIQNKQTETQTPLQIFASQLRADQVVIELVKKESSYLSQSIWNIDLMFKDEKEQQSLLLINEDIIVKILTYLKYWRSNSASKESVVFILKVLTAILKDAAQMDEQGQSSEKELLYRQNLFDRMNVTEIIIVLIYEAELEPEYLCTLMKFLVLLLRNGNDQVQKTAYDLFISSTQCERLFIQFANILNMQIQSQNKAHKLNAQENKMVCTTLHILQLFCEGHNNDLQNYLRSQYNQKNSTDLISLTVSLLNSYQISDSNVDSVLQCLETLNEMIQGPCKLNQIAITKSTFLEYAVQILDENVKIFHQGGQYVRAGFPDYKLDLHPANLARIKFKTLNIVISMLECNETSDFLMTRILRAIPLGILTQNLIRIYSLFKKYDQEKYTIEVFGRQDLEINYNEESDKYEMIIESGFNIIILIQLFLSNQKAKDLLQEDLEMSEVLKEFEEYNAPKQEEDILSQFVNFGGDFLNKGKEIIESKTKSAETLDQEEKKKLRKSTIKFFRSNICNIDVIRDEAIYTIYFPRLPTCDIPKTAKMEFHDQVDRTSSKTKLTTLIEKKSKELIETMEHEENLKQLFAISPIFEFFATNGKLWENLAFLTCLLINFIICVSYSQDFYSAQGGNTLLSERLYDPRLFFIEQFVWTNYLIQCLGIIMLVFSSLIVFFFIVKRAPLKVKSTWMDFNLEGSKFQIFIDFSKRSIKSFLILLQDVDVLYYTFFIIAGIVGLTVHYFFFAFHLMDVLRLEQLRTVVRAIYSPRKEIMLAILLLVIVEYYVGIISYLMFYQDFPYAYPTGNKLCTSLWVCFFSCFDLTFKYTGSLGSGIYDEDTINDIVDETYSYYANVQLADIQAEKNNYPGTSHRYLSKFYSRILFDNFVNTFIVFVLLNLIMGIIINTFGKLRQEQHERIEDQTMKCFICGITREKFDKNDGLGFAHHIKQEHYMWNYIYYKAYIDFKDANDYNGNESYIKHKIDNNDISWLPIKRARNIEDQDIQEDHSEELHHIQNNNGNINLKIEKAHQRLLYLSSLVNMTE